LRLLSLEFKKYIEDLRIWILGKYEDERIPIG
jgi:hypothetical protein